MKRQFFTGALCAALLCTAAFAAAPKEQSPANVLADPVSASAAIEMPAEATPYSIGVKAVIEEILNEDGQLSLAVKPEDGESLILHLSEETVIVDNQQAIPVNAADLKAGDVIYAYHSPMMTMSLPGQTPALAILTNLGDGAVAKLHVAESVSGAGDAVSALCDHGSILVSTSEDTVMTPYMTRQIVTAADIRAGVSFLAWYDAVAESYPAQAHADRVMLLPAGFETRELMLVIDGDMAIDAKLENGVVMVPARLTAEALGMKVGYRKEANRGIVSLQDGKGVLETALGETEYRYLADGAKDAEPFYGEAPYLENGSTWISAEAFEALGYTVTLTDNTVTLTANH